MNSSANLTAGQSSLEGHGAKSSVKLQSMQAVRAVAALLVVFSHDFWLFHSARGGFTAFHSLFRDGVRGVDLFFVLSGFIITYIHADDWGRPRRIANYFYNRLSRIYPMVWIMSTLAIAVYMSGFGGADKGYKVVDAWSYIASFLLLPQHGDALVGVTWTLKYEIFFYFLFSFLLINRRLGTVVMIIWQGAILVVAGLGISYTHLAGGFYLRPICLEFSIGMFCAIFLIRSLRRSSGRATLQFAILTLGVGTFVGAAMIGTYFGAEPSEFQEAIIFGGSSGLIIFSLVMLEAAGRLRTPNWLVKLGDASYAIYLVHYSVIGLSVALIVKLHIQINNVVCLMTAAIAVVAGLLFHDFVDRPLQRLLRDKKPIVLRSNTRLAGVSRDLATAHGQSTDLRVSPDTSKA